MIKKQRDEREHSSKGRMEIAGAAAEKQIAFYLQRAFVEDPNIWVFNDLRFENEDDDSDAAQIDHLVLHPHGFVIIESKSVTTRIRVNANGEWSRFWNEWKGMQSPVYQAQLQIEFLKRALNSYCADLVGTVIGKQIRFTSCPFEILVAVSDGGTIEREIDAPELVKADQVTDRIRSIYKRHQKAASPFTVGLKDLVNFKNPDGIYTFKNEEMERIAQWLMAHHWPRAAKKAVKYQQSNTTGSIVKENPPEIPPQKPTQNNSLGRCDKCGGQADILWGRYSYYWKCTQCGHNMSIKIPCQSCGQKMKIRKSKNEFFERCEECGVEKLYYDRSSSFA